LGQPVGGPGAHGAVVHVDAPLACDFDHAEAGDVQSRVDAEDAHEGTLALGAATAYDDASAPVLIPRLEAGVGELVEVPRELELPVVHCAVVQVFDKCSSDRPFVAGRMAVEPL